MFMFVFPIYTFSIRSPRFEFVCFFNFLFFFASLWTVFGGLTVMVQHFVKRCGSISDNFKVYNVSGILPSHCRGKVISLLFQNSAVADLFCFNFQWSVLENYRAKLQKRESDKQYKFGNKFGRVDLSPSGCLFQRVGC